MAAGLEVFLSGIALGLAEGLSPGPLIALIISETLESGREEGIKAAISPLITDSLIILFALVVLSSIPTNSIIIGTISLLGACFLIYLGLSNLKSRTAESQTSSPGKNALLKGVTTNLLNPNTYIFWLTIGGPIILESAHNQTSVAVLFLLGFYATLVGSKIAVAIAVDKSRSFVKGKYYTYLIRALGIALIMFALLFVRDALELFGFL